MPGYKYFEDYTIGQKQTTSGRTMTEADIRLFIGCSDNTHPVHVDAQYCERHPSVTGCILQGDLILGVADGFFAKEITPSKVPSIHYGMDQGSLRQAHLSRRHRPLRDRSRGSGHQE